MQKIKDYITQTLPKLRTDPPTLPGLVQFNIGKFYVQPVKTASRFVKGRYSVANYKEHLPELEQHLLTLLAISSFAPQPSVATTTQPPVATTPAVPDSSPSATRPQHIADYPQGALPPSVRAFGLNNYSRLRTEFSIAKDHLAHLALHPSLHPQGGAEAPTPSPASSPPSPQLLQNLATQVTIKEQRLLNFHALLDAHWQNYLGHTLPEDLIPSLTAEFATLSNQDTDTLAPASVPGSESASLKGLTLSELQSLPDSDRKTAAIQARIERDKKYLRRTDRQPSEETRSNIALAVQELHSLSILITDKQSEVAAHYGYQVPLEWQEPSLAERKAAQAKAKSDKAKAQRAQARQAKLQAKAEAQANNPYLQ